MIVLYAAALADLCGPVAPAPDADPADAVAYVQVGDDARGKNDARVAAIAYRRALAVDPQNAAARAALDALCRDDRERAELERANAARADDSRELLAAIARFRAGDVDEARDTLLAIVKRDGAAAAGAHFFLGLVALQQHDGALARAELAVAARDPVYSELAAPLARLAARDGVLALRALVASEFDTNPQLLPDTPPLGATTGPRTSDGDLLAVASIAVRPLRWLVAGDVVTYRDQFQVKALDFVGEDAHLGVEIDEHREHILARYDFDYDLLDYEPYLVAHRGTLAYRHEFGEVALAGEYSLRRRDYQQAAETSFNGWVHAADLGAIVHVTPTLDLDVRARFTRELTSEPSFANVAAGAAFAMRARFANDWRAVAIATGWFARYDAAEPDGTLRRDTHGEATFDVERDLGDYVLATCGAGAIGNTSTVADFVYWKLVVRCGIAVAFGAP